MLARRLCLAAGAVVAATAVVGSSVAPSVASSGPVKVLPDCAKIAHAPVVYRSAADGVVVRDALVRGDGGQRHDWACRGSGRSAAAPLGTAFPSAFVPGVTVADFQSEGPWLVDVAFDPHGWPTGPEPTTGPHIRGGRYEVELTNLGAGGGGASTFIGADALVHLAVLPAPPHAASAAVVWTESASHGMVALHSLAVLDTHRSGTASSGFGPGDAFTGPIDPLSVRIRGRRVTFTEGGRRRSFTLRV